MRRGSTPAWTLIIVPPTPRASTRRVGVRMRTVWIAVTLVFVLLVPVVATSWVWIDTQANTVVMMADRLAVHQQMVAALTDSLETYRRLALAERASKSPATVMVMPLKGRITSWFSRSRLHPILRVWRAHRGIDVAAAAGTRIVAPTTATVKFVGRKFGFGLVVELAHGGGVVTRYAHCRTALVKRGDRVVMGQTIATVGSSGLATAPHLHFEVLVKGTAVDPVKFLRAARAPVSTPTTAPPAPPAPAVSAPGVNGQN